MASAICANPKCTCVECTCGPSCRCGMMRLGSLERKVMDVFWDDPSAELSGRGVADQLPDYAYTTIATILDRLAKKELLTRRSGGKIILYGASDTRAVHIALLMREALDSTRDPGAALACFVQRLPEAIQADLRRALEDTAG